MNPAKIQREKVRLLTDLPNIGREMAKDLQQIGIDDPSQVKGRSPYAMYDELCAVTGKKHDPCVLDVFISITRFMDGEEPKPWWSYTQERKQYLQNNQAEKSCARQK